MKQDVTLLDLIQSALVSGRGILGLDPRRKSDCRSLLQTLREARAFTLSDSFTRLATDVSLAGPAKIKQLWQDARLPYDSVWVEFDETTRGRRQAEHNMHYVGEWAVEKTGYLMTTRPDGSIGLSLAFNMKDEFGDDADRTTRLARADRATRQRLGGISLSTVGFVFGQQPVLLADASYDNNTGQGLAAWRGFFTGRRFMDAKDRAGVEPLMREGWRGRDNELRYTNLDPTAFHSAMHGTAFNIRAGDLWGAKAVDFAHAQMEQTYGCTSDNPRGDFIRLIPFSRGWTVNATKSIPPSRPDKGRDGGEFKFVTYNPDVAWLLDRCQPCVSPFWSVCVPGMAKIATYAATFSGYMTAIEGDARMATSILALLQSQWIERAPMVREHRGRWVASRVLPYMEQHVLSIVAPKTRDAFSAEDYWAARVDPSGRTQRRHEVIGHWTHRRKIGENQWRIILACTHDWSNDQPDDPNRQTCTKCGWHRWWRKAHEAGDASKGWVQKRYRVYAGDPPAP